MNNGRGLRPVASVDAPRGDRHLLDRFFASLHRKFGGRYIPVVVLMLAAWAALFIVPAYSATGAYYWQLTVRQWAILAGLSDLALVASLPGMWRIAVRRHGPAIHWRPDDETADVTEAWESTLAPLPGTIVRCMASLLAWYVPVVVLGGPAFDFSPIMRFEWFLVVLLYVSGGALFMYLMVERSWEPVLRELAARMPTDFEPRRSGLSLQIKQLTLLMVLSSFTGVVVSTFTARIDPTWSVESKTAAILGASIVFTLALSLPLSLLVRGSTLTRIEHLRQAMTSVDRGDFDARVIPGGGDELDELSQSFNQMVGRLHRHDEELRESRARIVAAGDATRRRVERDLHDGAQQHLVALRLRLGLARQAVDGDPAQAMVLLDEARDDLGRALEELRDLAHGIYPAVLTTDGLVAALEVAAERCPVPVTVDDEGVGRHTPEVEAAVYFCCVEALQNTAKHAGPHARARIRLSGDARVGLRFEVGDDGSGYDSSGLGSTTGLQNMADRIGALGGTLTIASSPGEGTTVVGTMAPGIATTAVIAVGHDRGR